jgi:hypothetical protein
MSTKKILFVDPNTESSLLLREILEHETDHSFSLVKNSNEALSFMMGSSGGGVINYRKNEKQRPDMVIISEKVIIEEGTELLEIMNKYYSLKTICIYLMSVSTQVKEMVKAFGISGFFNGPEEVKSFLIGRTVNLNENQLRGGATAMSAIFLGSTAKVKLIIAKLFAKAALIPQFGTATVAGAVAITSAAILSTAVVNAPVEVTTQQTVKPQIIKHVMRKAHQPELTVAELQPTQKIVQPEKKKSVVKKIPLQVVQPEINEPKETITESVVIKPLKIVAVEDEENVVTAE